MATLEALQTQNWLWVTFWVFIGVVFLWTDTKKE